MRPVESLMAAVYAASTQEGRASPRFVRVVKRQRDLAAGGGRSERAFQDLLYIPPEFRRAQTFERPSGDHVREKERRCVTLADGQRRRIDELSPVAGHQFNPA